MKKMKSFQSLSAALILGIAFAACTNDASNKEATGNTDTTAASAATVNAVDANQEKLEANKKLATDFTQSLYGDKDSAAIDKYVADNIIQHDPVLQDGKAWLKENALPFLRIKDIKKIKVDIKHMAADGDKVWLLIREVAPNGKVFARVEIFRIDNGKIAERWLISEPEPKTSENKNGIF
jgi:predicted SnoaL-like aldol condensation-catalyzing enzyme